MQTYDIDDHIDFFNLIDILSDTLIGSVPLPSGFHVVIPVRRDVAIDITKTINEFYGTSYTLVGVVFYKDLIVKLDIQVEVGADGAQSSDS